MDYLRGLDEKYRNFTEVKIDAEPLVPLLAPEAALSEKLEFVKVAEDEDILLLELIKKGGQWTFIPLHASAEQIEEKIVPASCTLTDIMDTNLSTLFQSNSKKGVCGLQNLGNTCFMNSGL